MSGNRISRIRRSYFLLGLILVQLVYLLACLPLLFKYPWVWRDDAHFATVSYTFLTEGYFGSPWWGMGKWQEYTYSMPPLLFLLQAGFFKLFGFGIVQVRGLSVVLGSLVLCAFAWLLRSLSIRRDYVVLGTAVLALDILFLRASRIGRQEILVLLLTALAYGAYWQWRETLSRRFLYLAGVSAGASLLAHPLGAIPVAALGLHLLAVERKPKTFLVFLGTALMVFMLWLPYIMLDPQEFVSQIQRQLVIKGVRSHLPYVIETFRYHWRLSPAFLSLFLALILSWRWRPHSSQLKFATCALAAAAAGMTLGREMWYPAHLCLPAALIAVIALTHSPNSRSRRLVLILITVVLANHAAGTLWLNRKYNWRGGGTGDYRALAAKVTQILPPGAVVQLAEVADLAIPIKARRPDVSFAHGRDSLDKAQVGCLVDTFLFGKRAMPLSPGVEEWRKEARVLETVGSDRGIKYVIYCQSQESKGQE